MPKTKSMYRAFQAVSPGKLEMTMKPVVDPHPGYVRIRVEACGVCHSDAGTVEGIFPIEWPRVPGHEVVGLIDAMGEGVKGWTIGQRVGVGFLGGNCGYCLFCRGGDLVNCKNQDYTGIQHDGGYAEVMIAKASGPHLHSRGSLFRKCSSTALCWAYDLRCVARFTSKGWRPGCSVGNWWPGASRIAVCAAHGI